MLAMSVMTSTALAGGDESNRAFGFTAYTDGSTLNHNPNRFQWKDGNENFIEVRHEVTGNGSGAGHSNYMYAYVQAEDYYGAKWQVPDMLYYKCTSSRLVKNTIVTPGGRANTKYEEQQGLDTADHKHLMLLLWLEKKGLSCIKMPEPWSLSYAGR